MSRVSGKSEGYVKNKIETKCNAKFCIRKFKHKRANYVLVYEIMRVRQLWHDRQATSFVRTYKGKLYTLMRSIEQD